MNAIKHLLMPEFAMRVESGELHEVKFFLSGLVNVVSKVLPVAVGVANTILNPTTGVVTTYVPVAHTIAMSEHFASGNGGKIRFNFGSILKTGLSIGKALFSAFSPNDIQTGEYGITPLMGASRTITVGGVEMVAVKEEFDEEAFNAHQMRMKAVGGGAPIRDSTTKVMQETLTLIANQSVTYTGDVSKAHEHFAAMGCTFHGMVGDDAIVSYPIDPNDFEIIQGDSATTIGEKTETVTFNMNPPGPERPEDETDMIQVASASASVPEMTVDDFEVIPGQTTHLVNSKLYPPDDIAIQHDTADEADLGFKTDATAIGTTGFDSTKPGEVTVNYQMNTMYQGTNNSAVVMTIEDYPVNNIVALSTKREYTIGSEFDKNETMVMMGSNSTDTTDIVKENCYEIINWPQISRSVGYQEGIIQYTGSNSDGIVQTTLPVYFNADEYTSLKVEPTKTTYSVNETFDPSSVKVSGVHADGSEDVIQTNNLVFSDLESTCYVKGGLVKGSIVLTETGYRQITVSYDKMGGKPLTSTFGVKIADPIVDIDLIPVKTNYGLNEQFKSADLVVNGIRESGAKTELTTNDYEIQSFKTDETGTFDVHITYKQKVTVTKSYTIVVSNGSPYSVSIDFSRETYFKGEPFDYSSMLVYADYADGASYPIPSDSVTVIGFDSTRVGKRLVSFTYEGKTVKKEIEILADSITALDVKVSAAYKAQIGQPLDRDAFTVYAVSASGKREEVTDWEYEGFNPLVSANNQQVTIKYAGKSRVVTVDIDKPAFVTISVEPLVTEFEVGEVINKNLLKVTAFDKFGASREVDPAEFEIIVPPMVTVDPTGTVCVVEVTLETGEVLVGRVTLFFTGKKNPYSNFLIIENSQPWYSVGESFQEGSIKAFEIGSDGKRNEVSISIDGFNSSTSGQNILKITRV
jgi:hypothetical protein